MLRDALDAAFPADWREILDRRVPFYRTLSEDEQERFEDQIQHFVLTKTFSATGGLAVTDEMKVVVAAAACRLTLNLSWESYTHVGHVTLRADESWDRGAGRVIGLGERWKVPLSWPSLLAGMADASDGTNVGYHEFAHALDGADGSMDGEAQGPPSELYRAWPHVIANARADVARALRSNLPPPIDPYAAKNDAELFAVATEWFFERPRDLQVRMPTLYDLLREFYRQDPANAA